MSDYQIMLAVLAVFVDTFIVWAAVAALTLLGYHTLRRFVQRWRR